MIENNATYCIKLTHIATGYPDSIVISKDTYDTLTNSLSTLSNVVAGKHGSEWESDFFYDGLTTTN